MIRRIIFSVIAFAAALGAVWWGATLAPAEVPLSAGVTVPVTPARLDTACPGPLVTPAGGTGADPELGGAATGVTRKTYLDGDIRNVDNGKASDAALGAQVERVTGGDITGLAALTCGTPQTDQWIVAGATTVGASARLVLTNPAATAVEAKVVAHGALGELDSRTVAIGPDSQQEVLLEGVAVDVSELAVHVTATGTGVVAALQDSRLDGFQPVGTDWGAPSVLGEELAIAGVGTDGSAGQSGIVRIVAPEGARVSMTLATPDGPATWRGVASLEIEAGVVVEVPIPAVDVGTVVISANAPVAAAAVMTRTRAASAGVAGATASELRWVPAQAVGDAEERAAVAVGYSQHVVVYAPKRGTFTLTDGEGRTVATAEIAEGGVVELPVTAAAGAVLTAQGRFVWSVLAEDGDFITAFAPVRTTIDDVDVTVVQRPYVPAP
ncbi:DUF5719 family protein [Demequina sp.]|uniref:DUF5719 family protein n=1 Tax=Demequina sp. TaxID=2050685 RepID=UPI003D14CBAA